MGTGGERSAGVTIPSLKRWCATATVQPQPRTARTSHRSAGFTIVETIIVLAVSSLLATSVMLLVNGRQNKTMFQVASNDLKQQLEQIINETASGYYPTNDDFTCSGSTGNHPVITAVNQQQGKNDSCIFLGKALAFNIGDSSSGLGPAAYIVYPLIGNRTANTGGTSTDVSSYDDAMPIALAEDRKWYELRSRHLH
jgi:type II secretory pathway pseudopilin PulG